MAVPRGDRRGNLNTGFTESATPTDFHDAQVGLPKSHTLEFEDDALGSTSNTFHSSLEPSILSFFEDSSAEEEKIQIDEENEASLLSAFSEMLDSTIEDTLSPFDTLPDSKLFTGQRCQDSRVRLHSETATRVTRSFTPPNSKTEGLHSDRQLRPRLHRRTRAATVQRSDGEEDDLSEVRRRPARIFRIESDPELHQDEQPDGGVTVSLVDLVRHMHPYSLKVAVEKTGSLRDVEALQEEDVFVDVVGDDAEETPLVMPVASISSDLALEQTVNHPHNSAVSGAIHNFRVCQGNTLKSCLPDCDEQKKKDNSAHGDTAKVGSSGKRKKTVRFAPDLASIHIYQVDDEADEGDVPDASSSSDLTVYLRMPDCNSQTSAVSGNSTGVAKKTPSQNNTKLKTLSLQEYRLLREKRLPKEDKKMDYRTKWPSVSETPKELPPIPCIPGYNSSQVNVQTPSSNTKSSGTVAQKSFPKLKVSVRKPVQAVDPPNPVTVSLQPDAKILSPLFKEQKVMQKDDGKSQANLTCLNSPTAVKNSDILKWHTKSSQTCGTVKTIISAPSPPVTLVPMQTSQESPPRVQIPMSNQSAEEKSQGSLGEIGIEATDVTSLLEKFETQGLTPPATPPHQIWKPISPTIKAKQHEATKPSPSKTIQIIEPKPLPPSKIQLKPQLSSSIPAPSLFLAFIDHDYCSTQDFKLGKKRALSDVYMHNRSNKSNNQLSHVPIGKTCCKTECLSSSVLLSPESSPCRLEARRASKCTGAEAAGCSHCSCSQSPPPRGRARRRRHYRARCHESSSASSSRSSSCSSSASSCSPPRKRFGSWRSESSSSSSGSSSPSRSFSPTRENRPGSQSRSYRRSISRSFSRPRSRSHSPQPDWRQRWSSWKSCRQRKSYHLSQGKDVCRAAKQKAIDERRVVYVGRILGTMTKDELRERFALFGKIEDCTVHFRSHGDNYGFVTYYNTGDAFAAIEKGTKLRQPNELPFDICFGGRRQFCQSNYMDLDSNRDMNPAPRRTKDSTLDFDTLLKQAQRGLQT